MQSTILPTLHGPPNSNDNCIGLFQTDIHDCPSIIQSPIFQILQGLIKLGAALLKIRMAEYEIQDLIGARNLARSGIDLLSKVGIDQFMGLDIPKFLKAYQDFVNPIYDNKIPVINRKTPRIGLMI